MDIRKGLVHQGFFFHIPIAAEVIQHLVDEGDLIRTESGIGYKLGKRGLDRLTLHPNDTVTFGDCPVSRQAVVITSRLVLNSKDGALL